MINAIGITGGIGAGKTAVLHELQSLGRRTLDSDALVHALYRPRSPVTEQLKARWGSVVIDADGSVNRRLVAERVFQDPAELAWLNQLIHPQIRELIRRQAEAADSVIYCAVPLLFEVGWEKDMLFTVAVWCDSATQRQRLQERGWRLDEINARNQNQLRMDSKLERADFGIINNGTHAMLAEQVRRLLARCEP
jgi:dephospho-CoA kinase